MANANTTADGPKKRPLSPHIQIYKPLINMMMSIIHRITGAALYFGSVLLAWWLVAAAVGPDYYEFVAGIFGSTLGLLVMFGYTWALIHHMLGGIRHFIWDTGRAMDKPSVNFLSWGTIIASVMLTLLVWLAVFVLGGGVNQGALPV